MPARLSPFIYAHNSIHSTFIHTNCDSNETVGLFRLHILYYFIFSFIRRVAVPDERYDYLCQAHKPARCVCVCVCVCARACVRACVCVMLFDFSTNPICTPAYVPYSGKLWRGF